MSKYQLGQFVFDLRDSSNFIHEIIEHEPSLDWYGITHPDLGGTIWAAESGIVLAELSAQDRVLVFSDGSRYEMRVAENWNGREGNKIKLASVGSDRWIHWDLSEGLLGRINSGTTEPGNCDCDVMALFRGDGHKCGRKSYSMRDAQNSLFREILGTDQ